VRDLRFAQRCCWKFGSLECDTVSLGGWFLTFRRIVASTSIKNLRTLLIYIMKLHLTLSNCLFVYFIRINTSFCKQVDPRSIFPRTSIPITASYHNTAGEVTPLSLYQPFCKYIADHRKLLVLVSLIAGPFKERNLNYDRDGDREWINHSFYAFYSNVSQPLGRGGSETPFYRTVWG